MAYSSETFGKRLAIARKSRGFETQTEFANSSGLPVNSIARYEAGTVVPGLDNAYKLASALNVSLDSLTGRAPLIIDD